MCRNLPVNSCVLRFIPNCFKQNIIPHTKNWKIKLTTDIGYEYTEKQLALLNHIDQDLLKKISIDSVYKWEKGKMIAWHRNYLHTSDNFKNTGMKKKLALVIFLNKDD